MTTQPSRTTRPSRSTRSPRRSPRRRARFGVPAAALAALTVVVGGGDETAGAAPVSEAALPSAHLQSAVLSSALPIADDQLLLFSDLSDYVADGGQLTAAHNDVRRFGGAGPSSSWTSTTPSAVT